MNGAGSHAIRYDPKQGRWVRAWTDFPDIIFDRCRFQATTRFLRLKEFRNRYPHLHYLNRPLANKWRIHELFSQNPLIAAHLPDTKLFKNGRSLLHLHRQTSGRLPEAGERAPADGESCASRS